MDALKNLNFTNLKIILVGAFALAILFVIIVNRKKIAQFVSEVIVELKKVSWPTRKELLDSTWIVLISSVALAVYIAGIDFGLSKFLSVIIR